ncbi:unnamed protein product, partial [Rotaria sp. Silwood1]
MKRIIGAIKASTISHI